MAPVSSRIAAALRGGRLAKVPVAPLPILQKAELGRQHWERVLRLVHSEPHDYDLHLEKAYDSLVAFCEALIAAHGYRRKSSSHAFLLELGVELLDAVFPEQAAQLDAIREHLRQERNKAKYDRYGVVNERERDQALASLTPILEAIELAVFTKIGQPAPVHMWTAPAGPRRKMPGDA